MAKVPKVRGALSVVHNDSRNACACVRCEGGFFAKAIYERTSGKMELTDSTVAKKEKKIQSRKKRKKNSNARQRLALDHLDLLGPMVRTEIVRGCCVGSLIYLFLFRMPSNAAHGSGAAAIPMPQIGNASQASVLIEKKSKR